MSIFLDGAGCENRTRDCALPLRYFTTELTWHTKVLYHGFLNWERGNFKIFKQIS